MKNKIKILSIAMVLLTLSGCNSNTSSTSSVASVSSTPITSVSSSSDKESTSSKTNDSTSLTPSEDSSSTLVPHKMYVVGDSTVSSFNDTTYYYPRYGYGTQLSNYFSETLEIVNLAISGRSSKSFITEDNYQTLKDSISEGDYLVIGFGHNDEKSDDAARFTDASKPLTDTTSFKYSLNENYIKLAKEKGATPILCTPIVRANASNDYTGSSGHITEYGDYAEAIVELGTEVNVDVVNLRDITKTEYTTLGYDSAIYYHAMTKGKYDTDGTTIIAETASVDKTHLNIYGAKYIAYEFANAIKSSDSTLKNYVLPDIVKPTKDADLVANKDYKVSSYAAPDLANYQAPTQFTTITEGWYGVGFGDTGGDPNKKVNGYTATETVAGTFKVGQQASSNKGKFSSSSEGFAFVFRQVAKDTNFTLTAKAKVLTTGSTKQAGFGLMLRDDCYISVQDSSITSNYVTAGLLTNEADSVKSTYGLFKRESGTLSKGQAVLSDSFYAVDDEAALSIARVGQSITTEITYKGQTYTQTHVDFDLFAVDSDYMYVGMFGNRGTTAEFTEVTYTVTGTSQGA